ncbi:MAG: ECF RNA polymerase sigma factor SigE [Pelotomaculum sp. PtaB.Bin104]|nr:MAG: ECF RNA polymerase sigma factor SigE [Pelotomaculum sp. PtaB.Bin104]
MKSFTQLYQEYRPMIFRYLYRCTGSYDLAEELTQETFYQAALSIAGFRGESGVSTWLYRIARNVRSKHRRKASRLLPAEPAWFETAAATNGDPEESLCEAELAGRVESVLASLPENYRSVILMREVENLSYEEIGAALGKSPQAARVILFRAKKRFREIYSTLEKGCLYERK